MIHDSVAQGSPSKNRRGGECAIGTGAQVSLSADSSTFPMSPILRRSHGGNVESKNLWYKEAKYPTYCDGVLHGVGLSPFTAARGVLVLSIGGLAGERQ